MPLEGWKVLQAGLSWSGQLPRVAALKGAAFMLHSLYFAYPAVQARWRMAESYVCSELPSIGGTLDGLIGRCLLDFLFYKNGCSFSM